MSWLAEIAGKAENLLNQLDQTAAETLNTPEVTGHRRNSSKSRKNRNDDISISDNSHHNDSSSTYLVDSSSSSSSSYNQPIINNDKTESNTTTSSSSNGRPSGRPRSKPTTKQEAEDSNDNSMSLNNSTKSTTLLNGNKKEKSDEELLNFLNSPNQREIDEISLLKSEISTQVRETGMILKNFKKLQQDYEIQGKTLEEVQKKLEFQNSKFAAKEMDKYNENERLHSEIKAKDDELKTIRNRLDEALEKLKHMDCSTQNRVEQLELENRQVKETNTELEEKVNHLALQLTTLEKNSQSIKESLVATESEFNVYKEKAKSILRTKDELIASIKDDKNQGQNNEGSTFLTESQIMAEIGSLKNERELLHAEITQNRSFCDSLKEDNRRLEREIHSNRISNLELQESLVKERDIKNTIQEENLQLSQNLSALQLELEREKSEKRKLDEKLRKHEKEFGTSSSSMSRSFSGSLNEFNNNQNANLIQSSSSVGRNLNQSPVPMMMSSLNNCDNIPDERDNLKTRIKALTQSLLEKQSLINNISADKQLLHLRVERLQTQIQEMTENSESISNGGLPQTVISNQPLYLSESPWDTRIKTKVKRVYSRVDNLCCQFGIAMRHRPNLRLGFSTYIIFLHLWVFFVLFYWSHHATISNTLKP